jgi:hypothetical protein
MPTMTLIADSHSQQHYKIIVDKQSFEWGQPTITGRQVLELAGKVPVDQFALYLKIPDGQPERVPLDRVIDLRHPGTDRFLTLPLDQTEGLGLRRAFAMPADDTKWLESTGWRYEFVIESGIRRVVIHDFPVPSGYQLSVVGVNVRIETGYPDAQIDMAYFYPALERLDGRPIRATCADAFDGQIWQRWSRHRTGANPWRPGVDCLATHMTAVQEWLVRELQKP